MKIEGPRALTAPSTSKKTASVDGAGFSLPAGGARAAAPAAPTAPLTALDGLLALQEEGGGKRRRQLRRGADALDTLDRLAASLLAGGNAAHGDLDRLAAALADREPTGDRGLDSVLREIDVRAAVELAKREKRP